MQRLPEIDIARGCAIVLMIVSNFITDLQYFFGYSAYETFWYWFARATAFIFIFLVGVSLVLSSEKAKKENKFIFLRYLKRGLFIFALGLLLTIVTYLFIPSNFIQFGVLHLIGISIIFGYFFVKAKNNFVNVFFGCLFIIIGLVFSKINFNSDLFFIFGAASKTFSSVDYFPIFPWFGAVLLGIFFGKKLYKTYKPFVKENLFSKLFSWLGRNSLMIYLVHQPVLLGILFLLA